MVTDIAFFFIVKLARQPHEFHSIPELLNAHGRLRASHTVMTFVAAIRAFAAAFKPALHLYHICSAYPARASHSLLTSVFAACLFTFIIFRGGRRLFFFIVRIRLVIAGLISSVKLAL